MSLHRESINQLLHLYGESVRRFFHEQQRANQFSLLFNLPGRLVLGSYCYYEHMYELLQRICQRVTPEHLGTKMKQLGVRPNYINLNSLLLGYLNGRQQAILRGEARDDDPNELAFILDFWTRTACAYRNDGKRLPDEAGFTIPILPPPVVDEVVACLRSDYADDERQWIRRAIATIELFTFVLNGEARVGIFHHGPYELSGGDQLIIKELVGLQEDFYSWAGEETQLPYASIVRAMRVRHLQCWFDLFGSLRTEPREYEEAIRAQNVFAIHDGAIRPISIHQLQVAAERAGNIQIRLYRTFMKWSDRQRIEYGAELYANLLRTFGDLADLGREFHQDVRERFRETTMRHIEALVEGEPPLVLQHIAETEGPIYHPLRCP